MKDLEKRNVYIINVDAKSLINANKKYGQYNTLVEKEFTKEDGTVKIIKDNRLNKLLFGCIPYSLEMIYFHSLARSEIKIINKKQYTKAFINVTFKYNLDGLKRKDIRDYLYKNGFNLDGEHYVLYKRSSAKSRVGSCLFVKEKFKEKLQKWSRLGLKFEEDEELDMASLKAYESLTLSQIENTITIDPKSILIIPDLKSKFKEKVSVTYLNKYNEVITEDKEEELVNTLFDGEGLADESLFTGDYKNKGFMLLRARYLKSAVFNTKLHSYFKYMFGEEWKDKTVKDKYGRDKRLGDINIVITENSLKYLKFSYKFKSEEKCFDYWVNNVGSTFGICKCEHSSKYGTFNQMSYQMVASLDLNKEEVRDIAQYEIEYINLLKNDLAVFKNYIELNDNSPSRDCMLNLLNINADFKYTKVFKDWKRNVINKYINNIAKGKLKLPQTDYSVIFGNPYEYLKHSIGLFEGDSSLKGNQVYCPRYNEGESLVAFRSPNINQGNVMSFINKDFEGSEWFNLTNNIVCVNAIDYGIQDRGQSLDYDSDMMLLSNNKILVEKGIDCQKYLTPVNHIEPPKRLRKYNLGEMADVDHLIAQNYIGDIVNCSAHLNAYYWHEKNTRNDKNVLKEIYNNSSLCSSLAGLEIDKAKKFVNLDCNKIIRAIKKDFTYLKNDYGKIINPIFFRKIDTKPKKVYKSLECGMDYLQDILKEEIVNADRSTNIPFKELINKFDLKKKSDRKQKAVIIKLLNNYSAEIKKEESKRDNEEESRKEFNRKKDTLSTELINQLKKLKISKYTIADILISLEEGNSDIKVYTLMALFKSHLEELIDAFKPTTDNNVDLLEEDVDGNIEIWGTKYKRVK